MEKNKDVIVAVEQTFKVIYGTVLKWLLKEDISDVDLGMSLWEIHSNYKKNRIERLSNRLKDKAEKLDIPTFINVICIFIDGNYIFPNKKYAYEKIV